MSDRKRWSNPANYSSDWLSWNVAIGKMIHPNSRVLEFGAGIMALRDYLPEGCTYYPSDFVDRGEDIILCDLNRYPLPAFPEVDVIVFSGVLEYIHNIIGIFSQLKQYCQIIVASYAMVVQNRRDLLKRLHYGWVNDYSSDQFISVFQECGFFCDEQEQWNDQMLCKFRQVRSCKEKMW